MLSAVRRARPSSSHRAHDCGHSFARLQLGSHRSETRRLHPQSSHRMPRANTPQFRRRHCQTTFRIRKGSLPALSRGSMKTTNPTAPGRRRSDPRPRTAPRIDSLPTLATHPSKPLGSLCLRRYSRRASRLRYRAPSPTAWRGSSTLRALPTATIVRRPLSMVYSTPGAAASRAPPQALSVLTR